MRATSSLIFLLLVIFLLGSISCKSSPSDTATQNEQPETPRSPEVAENNDNKVPESKVPESKEASAPAPDNNVSQSKPAGEKALPAAPSKGATRVEMRNVDFHSEDTIVLRIRSLHGALLRRSKANPPAFDDKRSFIMRIDSGTIGIRADSLTNLMNNYVFAYPKAPLKKITISTKGNQIKMAAKMHKVIDVPVRIVGNLTPTPDGKIRLHPTSIKAAGIPVKGFLHLFGLDLSDVMKANEDRGVRIDDDDIIMDPERMMPPPLIRGRITAVRVEGDEVIQVFGSGKSSGGRADGKSPNYMYYRGGTLRFGKLTMANADLRIVDADPKNAFDFSIDNYNRQLVAGHSKNTADFGLVVFMPDYYRVRGVAQNANNQGAADRGLSKPSVESAAKTLASLGTSPRTRRRY
jgi:hypothetical protein